MERQFSNRQSKENAGAARYLKVVIIIRVFLCNFKFCYGGVYVHLTRDFMTPACTSRTCMFEAKELF